MIERSLYLRITRQCFAGKVILLFGARQVGKTTLLKRVIQHFDVPSVWFNADEADVYAGFVKSDTSTALRQFIGPDKKLVIIDEAQQIPDIGKKLKLLHDNYPDIQVIATGSSAFELQNQANESLTGRKTEMYLFPLSYEELEKETSAPEQKRLLQTRLIYGSYPEIINNPGNEKENLIELVNSYLYKDILKLDGIRKSSFLQKLLQALAFQIGSEVSYHELSKTIGNIDTVTVEKYLDLLEKAFIIFKLPSFNRNLRNEIKKGKKYYFRDNGVRNVLISNFNNIDLRADTGILWENYIISERMKFHHYNQHHGNYYFWRTHDQAEIDFIEERDGMLYAYEIKWRKNKVRFPASFLEAYPNHETHVVTLDNYYNFIRAESK